MKGRMIDLVLRFRYLLLSVFVTLSVASGFGVSKLRFEFLRSMPLPDNDPAVLANHAMGDHFGGHEPVTFLVETPNILSKESIQTLKDLTEDVTSLTGLASRQAVSGLATIPEIVANETDLLIQPLLSTPDNLEARLRASPFVNDLLISPDRKASLVIASLGERAAPDPTTITAEFLRTHAQEVNELVKKYSQGDTKVWATSTSLVLQIGQERTQHEILVLSLLAFVMLLVVFYISFHNAGRIALASAVMLLSIFWTLGVMGLMGIPLSNTSIYVIIVVVAVGSSYTIHVISTIEHYIQKVTSRRIAVRLASYEFSTTLLMVSLTSVLSSVSLITFDIPDIRELGVFQGLGITFAYLLSFFILPILAIRTFKARSNGASPHLETPKPGEPSGATRVFDRAVEAFGRLMLWPVYHLKWLSLALVVSLFYLSVTGIQKVVADFVLEETIPEGTFPRASFERIREKFGTLKIASILVEDTGGDGWLTPEGLTTIDGLETAIRGLPNVLVLPTLTTLFRQLNQAMFQEAGLPATSERLEQALLLVGKKKLGRLVDRSMKRTLITFAIRESDPQAVGRTLDDIRAELAKLPPRFRTHVGGSLVVMNSVNNYIIRNKIISIMTCLLIVFLLCSLVNGSLKLGFISVLPATLAAMLTFAYMGWAGIRLDLGTATITTIAIGVGTDFAVHYLMRFRSDLSEYLISQGHRVLPRPEDYGHVIRITTRGYGKAIILDAMSNIFGFGPLVLSSFPILKIAGTLLILNQLVVIGTTFFVTPLLLLVFKPGLPKRGEKETQHELVDRPLGG